MSHEILSEPERSGLLFQHKTVRDKRVADRIKAVLLRDDGWSNKSIAEALFLSESGVREHLKDYEERGKLKPENGGSSSMMSELQIAELLAHLDDNLYSKVSDICGYVHATFGIRYSVRGMTDLITRHGFSFHQPCGVPAKADAEAQEAFVEEYENIKASLGDNDQLVFMDGVHPTQMVRFVRGWIRKGERREIPTNASQKRINILGTLNLETMQVHSREYDTLNAENVVAFLTFLLAAMPKGALHVILDRGRYQNCTAVWEFAAANTRLRLHYLPGYSPNLNAIERLWKIMHEHTTNNQYHATFKDFTESIRNFFNKTVPEQGKKWIDRLNDNFRLIQSPLTTH